MIYERLLRRIVMLMRVPNACIQPGSYNILLPQIDLRLSSIGPCGSVAQANT